MNGKYAREYALTCNPMDSWRFSGLKKGISMRHRRIWVRRVEFGDIITSRGKIVRWKIIEDNETGNLYLGFIEEIDHFSGFQHGKVSMYVVDFGEQYRLYRMKSENVLNYIS